MSPPESTRPRPLRSLPADADPDREGVNAMIGRARLAGYELRSDPVLSGRWQLVDPVDGLLFVAGGLPEIDHWLNG